MQSEVYSKSVSFKIWLHGWGNQYSVLKKYSKVSKSIHQSMIAWLRQLVLSIEKNVQKLQKVYIKASDCMVEAISTQHWKVSKSFKKYPSKQGDCMVEALSLQAWEIFKSFKKYPSKQGACDCMVEAISLQVWEGWQLCYIFLSHFLLEPAKTWR